MVLRVMIFNYVPSLLREMSLECLLLCMVSSLVPYCLRMQCVRLGGLVFGSLTDMDALLQFSTVALGTDILSFTKLCWVNPSWLLGHSDTYHMVCLQWITVQFFS